MSKCLGCGVILQNGDVTRLGYTKNLDNDLCERCFRIRNYNDYKFVVKDNNDYINILKNISKTKSLVLLVVDLFNISYRLSDINKYLDNDIILVLSKRDILPKSCYDKKFVDYFKDYKLNIIDSVVVSSNKNYNIDNLYEMINKYKKGNSVYVVGFTNSGKSTLINKIIYNYSDNRTIITTSNLPSTTIDSINIKINDSLILVDTPGLIDVGDISNSIDGKTLKHIIPTKEIKPITYQVKKSQTVLIEDLVRIDVSGCTSMTLYISNNLNNRRYYKNINSLNDLNKHEFCLENNCDVVIQGFGFIKFTKACNVIVYVDKASVFVRKNLI